MKGNLHKHTLNLRKGDMDYLESMYKPKGIASSFVVRTLVSQYVDRMREAEQQATGELNPTIQLDLTHE